MMTYDWDKIFGYINLGFGIEICASYDDFRFLVGALLILMGSIFLGRKYVKN